MKKLKVLHFFSSYLNITENWAHQLLYNTPNCDVVVASKKFLRCNFYSKEFQYIVFPFQQIENVQNNFSTKLFNRIISYSLKAYPWYVSKVCGKCDLMHSHFAPIGWHYMKLAKKLNIPHIVSFYGRDYEKLLFHEPIWKKRYQELFREVDLFFCEGSHGANKLQKMGCSENKIVIARLGVDVNQIPYFDRSKRPNELNLLQIASFREKKGHKFSLQAFMNALKICPNMTITFVGPDKQGIKNKLQKQIKSHNIEQKVSFVDLIDNNKLHSFMKDYHVFIHPSCYTEDRDCEGGAPVVLLDAQATGMPVISTTHCDIPDEVIHEQTGLISPERDINHLTESILNFYKMGKDQYSQFASKARQHIQDNYNIKNNAVFVKQLYNSIANN